MDMASCSTPQRRSKADLDQAALKCPRCHSFNTKFCYYNNYNFTQPRHFCKSCKRYWTKGGTLRNVPVGGGCRKNKRSDCQSSHSKSSASQPGRSASAAFMAVAGVEEGGGEGSEGIALHEEQVLQRCRSEKQGFTPEFSSLPLLSHLHGLPHLDSSYSDFCSSPSRVLRSADPSFIDHSNSDLSQAFTQIKSDVVDMSLTDPTVVSDIEPSFSTSSNSGFHLRMQHAEHHDHQQQEKMPNIMPVDQILIDEKAWIHLAEDMPAETIDQMRDNFFVTGSQKLPYSFKDEAFDWKLGSEGFDPTNDLSYMGGPEFWSI